MMMPGLSPRTQHRYLRNVQRFVAFLGQSSDTAASEDLRAFHIHQHEYGANADTINRTITALHLFYIVTLSFASIVRAAAQSSLYHTA